MQFPSFSKNPSIQRHPGLQISSHSTKLSHVLPQLPPHLSKTELESCLLQNLSNSFLHMLARTHCLPSKSLKYPFGHSHSGLGCLIELVRHGCLFGNTQVGWQWFGTQFLTSLAGHLTRQGFGHLFRGMQ